MTEKVQWVPAFYFLPYVYPDDFSEPARGGSLPEVERTPTCTKDGIVRQPRICFAWTGTAET